MADGSWIRIKATEVHLDAQTVNSIIEVALGKRAMSVTQKPELRQAIGEKYIEAVTPFVPYKQRKDQDPGDTTGHLRASGRATTDGRVYWTAINSRGQNYAGYVYDPDETRWPDGTYANPSTKNPMTYPQWVKQVQPGSQEYSDFITNITPIIREAFKDDG